MSCSSLIRWLDTSTARPSAASDRRKPRIQTMPSGSMPLNGSSSISTGGSPSSAAAMPSRCRMPSEKPPARRRATAPQAGLLDHLVDPPAGQALRVGQPQQVVAGGPAGLQRAGVQQRPDVAQRAPQAAVRPPADQRGARVRGVEAEDHPHRGGLAGAVGADEPGDLSGWTVKDIPSRARVGPNRLRSPLTTILGSVMRPPPRWPRRARDSSRRVSMIRSQARSWRPVLPGAVSARCQRRAPR